MLINYQKILDMMAEGLAPICLDVRESWRRKTFNPGGESIPHNMINSNISRLSPYKDRPIIVCCMNQDSNRTRHVMNTLRRAGFKQVFELEQGLMKGWQMNVKPGQKLPGI